MNCLIDFALLLSTRSAAFFLVFGLALIVGCADASRTVPSLTPPSETKAVEDKPVGNLDSGDVMVGKFEPELQENGEASHITVQHVLIGFAGSVPGKDITRSKQEAAKLATEILNKAQSGEDFAQLVEEYTDDSPPGIYHMANFSQPSDMDALRQEDVVFARDGMVPAFGNVGFPLAVGEIGMAGHDPQNSPYGWHVVKRLK